jgi:hypothetical protein
MRAAVLMVALLACGGALAQSPKQPQIEVIDLKWHLRGNTALIDTLTLSSFSDQGVKDMTLKCTTWGRSHTDLTEVTITLYDKIAPKGVQHFSNVNLGPVHPQSVGLECKVIGALPQ